MRNSDQVLSVLKKCLIGLALVAVWSAQYTIVVPAVYCWRLLVWVTAVALKMGFAGIVLLCVPVVGWLVLVMIIVMRHQHTQTMASLGVTKPVKSHKNVLLPYGMHYLKG